MLIFLELRIGMEHANCVFDLQNIEKAFKKMGFATQVKSLSDFYDHYGLEGDDDGDGKADADVDEEDDSEEDEDEDESDEEDGPDEDMED